MPQAARLRILAAKIETTVGTAESLSSSDTGFLAYDILMQNETEKATAERMGAFGYGPSVAGGYKGRLTFKTEIDWDGTATEPAWADTLWPACGWVKTGQVFYPISQAPGGALGVKTLTMAVYQADGATSKVKKLKGCMGTFKMHAPTGANNKGYIEWDFMGVWVPEADVSFPSTTHPTAKALRYANSTTTWNSVALCVSELVFDAGNNIILRECGAAEGFEAAMVIDRRPLITGDPEACLVATQDRDGQFLGSTEGVLTWGYDGPTNSVLTISAPKAEIIDKKEGNRGGLVVDNLTWQCNKNGSTADQEATFTFTAAS